MKWYYIFGGLWLVQFIIACQHMIIAGAVATWFFTRDKSKLGCPIAASTCRLIRYHLGSVAFGSLIIALVQLCRLILLYIEKMLRYKKNKMVTYILKCLSCCLWCFEKFLKFLNRNAYIEIAIHGYGLCKAAQKAFMLIVGNALRIAAINSVGDFTLFLGKIGVTACTAVIGLLLVELIYV
ncbi:PREDICTED: choline transporter-like protein 1 [Priapulus caudatus]|uniref:Choline transporter-like protein n=1 Tax=Priapulus caudatus TaxID=37621 RepID=A0ABM1DRI7_PRICU|nr:PREDICTED: choline transporter-like protein 1 [Priapulus caudatus]